MSRFEQTLFAGWGDMDFNGHMRNTAYLDKSGDVRMRFFEAHGFPMREFRRLGVGPVIMKDEVEYFREVDLLDSLRVTLARFALSEDGSRFGLCNEFFRPDGKLAARVRSTGGWLDLAARRLVAPAPALRAALDAMPATDDFQVVPSSLKTS